MAKVKIPVPGTVGKSITFDPDATVGATLGVNLFAADGSLLTIEPVEESLLFTDISGVLPESRVVTLVDHLNFFIGSTLDDSDITVTSNGSVITLSLELLGGGDLRFRFTNGVLTIDTTPAVTIALTAGTDTTPVLNYVSVLATGALDVSTVNWPTAEHAPVATVLCQSAASAQTDGLYKVHAWTDHIHRVDGGHLSHMNFWIRHQQATWLSGVLPTISDGVGTFDISTIAGEILQLHQQTYPAFDTAASGEVLVINDPATAYKRVADLTTILTDADNVSMSGKYFNLVLWGSVSQDAADSQLMINLPTGSYNNLATALSDIDETAVFEIPGAFRGTGFLIGLITMRHQSAAGGTWTHEQTVDLRGLFPSTSAGGSVDGGLTVAEANTLYLPLYDLTDEEATAGLTNSDINKRFSPKTPFNPERYGAAESATKAVNQVAFDTAMQAGFAENRPIEMPEGTFLLNQLTLIDGVGLIGLGEGKTVLDFSTSTISSGAAFITGTGTVAVGETTDTLITRFDSDVNAGSHGLVVGDWFRIVSTVDCMTSAAGVDRLGDRGDVVFLTETHQVFELTDSDNFTIRGSFRFGYPTGSSINKITPLSNILLAGFSMDCGAIASRLPVSMTLARHAQMDSIDVINAGGEVRYSACFDGSKINSLTSSAPAGAVKATNWQLLKIINGCSGVQVINPVLANGGQLIDITYTPGNSLAAPCLDTSILGGLMRNSSLSAITDHPGMDGTTIADVVCQNVKGAVLIRSRDASVSNIRATGQLNATSGFGIWAGENGYTRGLTVADCHMRGFDVGYQMSGQGDSIEERDTLLNGNQSVLCTVGEAWGTVTQGNGTGARSIGSRHIRSVETGIKVTGDWDGLEILDFTIRGPCSNAGIEISGDPAPIKLRGQVIDLGAAIPPIKVTGTIRLDAHITRHGSNGLDSGVVRSLLTTTPRHFGSDLGGSHTGDTNLTEISANFAIIPAGVLDENASIKVQVWGTVTGTNGTKTVKLSTGGNTWKDVVLPAAATGTFFIEFRIVGTGDQAQQVFTRFEVDGVTTPDPTGPTARTINLTTTQAGLDLKVQLANGSDAIDIDSVEAIGYWA